jgi:hypothetical protein
LAKACGDQRDFWNRVRCSVLIRETMNAERWREIDNLLSEALKREPGRREDFLELACAGDAELRKEVRVLLEAHDGAGSFMEKPAVEATASSSPPSLIGRTRPVNPSSPPS